MLTKTILALAVMCTLVSPAAAVTLKFTATAAFPAQSSDFSIIFDDLDGDMQLSANEVVSFSGFTSFQLGQSYSELLRISPVPAETDEPQTFTSGGFPINSWLFGEGSSQRTTRQPSSFTYAVSAVSEVPLPAPAVLLLAGLGALFGLKRRGDRAA